MEVLNYGPTHLTPTQEANFFIPLLSIKGLRYFSVEVPWDATPVAEDLHNAPFTLTRTDSIPVPGDLIRQEPVICELPNLYPGEEGERLRMEHLDIINRQIDGALEKRMRRRLRREVSYLNPFRRWTG